MPVSLQCDSSNALGSSDLFMIGPESRFKLGGSKLLEDLESRCGGGSNCTYLVLSTSRCLEHLLRYRKETPPFHHAKTVSSRGVLRLDSTLISCSLRGAWKLCHEGSSSESLTPYTTRSGIRGSQRLPPIIYIGLSKLVTAPIFPLSSVFSRKLFPTQILPQQC